AQCHGGNPHLSAIQAVGLDHGADRARLLGSRIATRVCLARRAAGPRQGQPAGTVAGAHRLHLHRRAGNPADLHRRGRARRARPAQDLQVSARMDAMAPLVDVRDLSVRFAAGPTSIDAVSHVSFSVAKGEIVALVGESGSGKTVSALSIMRLLNYPSAS